MEYIMYKKEQANGFRTFPSIVRKEFDSKKCLEEYLRNNLGQTKNIEVFKKSSRINLDIDIRITENDVDEETKKNSNSIVSGNK